MIKAILPVLFCGGFLYACSSAIAHHYSPEGQAQAAENRKEEAAKKEQAALVAEALKSMQAESDAKWRKACKNPDMAIPDMDDVRLSCEVAVDKAVDAPGHLEYDINHDIQTSSLDGCRLSWRSFVIGRNALGVKVKQPFTCTYDPQTRTARVKL